MALLRAYVVRGVYDWLVDHGMTPYFLVDAEYEGVEVPWEFVQEGKIVLNAAPGAIRHLQLEDDFIGFEASFSGRVWQIFFPTAAVMALYSRESGQGVYAREEGFGLLINEGEDEDELDPKKVDQAAEESPKPEKKQPFLKVVK